MNVEKLYTEYKKGKSIIVKSNNEKILDFSNDWHMSYKSFDRALRWNINAESKMNNKVTIIIKGN